MAAGTRLSAREGRRFAATVGTAFVVLALVAWLRDRTVVSVTLAIVATTLGCTGALVPERLGPVQRAWMGLGHAISRITKPIILAVIYFMVVTPFGFVYRWMGRRRPDRETGWHTRAPRAAAKRAMERQF